MEKYNYDFIADQEPDGNSEWYPANVVDKKVERLENGIKKAVDKLSHGLIATAIMILAEVLKDGK